MSVPSHDHVFRCSGCGMEEIGNDCTCPNPVTYRTCPPCKEQEAYERVEAARNADY